MKFNLLNSTFLASSIALAISAPMALAGHHDDEEIPFDVARIFFELNNTDGDLGIHAEIDGQEWKNLKISDFRERKLLSIQVKGRLRRQGLTEIFFESAEPNFSDLPPEAFFKRFPEGEYEIEGRTLDGEEMESEVEVSHVMPAPVENIRISGEAASEDCDAEDIPVVAAPVVISWDPVTTSHPDLGATGVVEIEYYEVVVEIDDTPFKSTSLVPAGVTEFAISDDLIALSDEFKFEILARDVNGNKTAVESCFGVN